MMLVSVLGMLAGTGRGGGGAHAAEANEDRKDYLRYLDQLRRDVTDTGDQQRRAWSGRIPIRRWPGRSPERYACGSGG